MHIEYTLTNIFLPFFLLSTFLMVRKIILATFYIGIGIYGTIFQMCPSKGLRIFEYRFYCNTVLEYLELEAQTLHLDIILDCSCKAP